MKRMTLENIKEYISINSDCILLNADGYRSSRDSALLIKCNCGEEFKATFKTFKQGRRRCDNCTNKNIIIKNCKYSVGDIVDTKSGKIKILEIISIKNDKNSNCRGYKYICLKDGYIGEKKEKELEKGGGCPVCSNQIIIKGINDLATSNPELIKYFKNIEDTYKYSTYSNKPVIAICPNCGFEKEMRINDLSNQGFGCTVCETGVSMGEKIMSYLLLQLNIDFEKEKSNFIWLKTQNKRYDFYIPHLNILIEMHGKQHYKQSTGNFKRKLEEEQSNDLFKKELALKNGIKEENYIVVDCRESDLDFIKQNILVSRLNTFIDLSNIDWISIFDKSSSSEILKVSEMYNKGMRIFQIAKETKYNRCTIRDYLKRGKEININNYSTK